ncbi:hypothetical protein CBP51_03230 [Cellvibrio mixtus]|uniref:Integrase catalytic domain-containing protein n=1 Tax=Cellvibrio mixtus TaxID=39650 RepID=A0A266Q881_9GAMM|nr:hypothetical protein [Cellvibrio mixtus]OZY86058.1 hypothetical protein CBP51_03230 [Cellvibrio mixtus]
MNIFEGQHISNPEKGISFRVCFVSFNLRMAALADMHEVNKSYQIRKPLVKTFEEIYELVKTKKCSASSIYPLPLDIDKTDAELIDQRRSKWIVKRDLQLKNLGILTDRRIIESYLFLSGIKKTIEGLCGSGSWNTPGAFYKALNRYIVYGCVKNAMLPFSLKNVGSNYLHVSDKDKHNPKRGRGGSDNQNSRSKSKGITKEAKANIANICIYAKKKLKKVTVKYLFNLYKDRHQVMEINGPDGHPRRVPMAEHEGITYQQFRYHFNNTVDDEAYLRLAHGNLNYEKDFAPRSGVARDGVIGPSFRYEIDCTILDIYVRYPYGGTKRSSMGRPVVYIVIDVYSTAIVGFYIGFTGPNWEGASEALINAFSNKVDFCKKYGIDITEDEWCCSHICTQIALDNGVDYPDAGRQQLLTSMIGISEIISLALYRGDAKGICERKFRSLQEDIIVNQYGAVYKKPRKEDAHPANTTLWDLESLTKVIIQEIIFHNKSSDRLKNHNFDMSSNSVGITPLAIYKYGIEREMNQGRKTDDGDMLRVRWALLREYEATVNGESASIVLEGLHYHCEYADEHRWYHKAKFKGNFKIRIRKTRASTNTIWYRTEENEIIELQLKADYKSECYANQHWDAVQIKMEENKDEIHALSLEREKLRIDRDHKIAKYELEQLEAVHGVPKITAKSMASNKTKSNKNIQKQLENNEIAERYRNEFRSTPNSPTVTAITEDFNNF